MVVIVLYNGLVYNRLLHATTHCHHTQIRLNYFNFCDVFSYVTYFINYINQFLQIV